MSAIKRRMSSPIEIVIAISRGQSPETCASGISVCCDDDWSTLTQAIRTAALQASLCDDRVTHDKLNKCADLINDRCLTEHEDRMRKLLAKQVNAMEAAAT
jgi:hypothetical protein